MAAYISDPIYLTSADPIQIKTVQQEQSGLHGRVISLMHRHYDGSNDRYLVIGETPTTLSTQRLQRDTFNPNKYYLTDEVNTYHGIIHKGPLSKGRWITVYEIQEKN